MLGVCFLYYAFAFLYCLDADCALIFIIDDDRRGFAIRSFKFFLKAQRHFIVNAVVAYDIVRGVLDVLFSLILI